MIVVVINGVITALGAKRRPATRPDYEAIPDQGLAASEIGLPALRELRPEAAACGLLDRFR